MDSSNYINLVLTALTGILAGLTGILASRSVKEQTKSTYMQFYEIIAHHHTEEVTGLRREVMIKLPDTAERARAANKLLLELDPELQLKTSSLANYYEGIGTFLKGGWSIFPTEARNAMLEMLHNSVSRTWPLIEKYKDQIYPKRPLDWAGNYKWLYDQVVAYRK